MYDMHYDLLTILYFNMKNKNKFSDKVKTISDCKKIYGSKNVIGGVINLYFMTPEEMKEEIDISLDEMEDLKNMFLKSIKYVETYKQLNIIPENTDFIYSIEGCDYIKDENELEELYNFGLRSILPVWNHNNKYGSGNRTDNGLTEDGKKLIKKAIELGIIVDVSHSNPKTFNDIIDIVEVEKDKNPIVMASHSNVRSLCDRQRNLTDEQLIRLKNVGGYIGLFTNGNFLSIDNEQIPYEQREVNFMKHLDYIINVTGFDIDRIILSTDDMNFNPDESYHKLEAFPIENIAERMHAVISNKYNDEIATKIMIDNSKNLIIKVNEKTNGKHI